MGKLNKKYIIGGILLFSFLLSVFLILYYVNYKTNQESPLYTAVSDYDGSQTSLLLSPGIVYSENSGEKYFLEAFGFYVSHEYDKAEGYFLQALNSKYHDPALPALSYYFIERCNSFRNIVTSDKIIIHALEEMAKYPPISNDTAMIWNLTDSFSSSHETGEEVISLLEKYLAEAEGVSLYTWAWIKNYIGMLEYNNEKYAKSIRHFYDVETTLSNYELTPELESELLYTREYIANIYFAFKNYEQAALLYQDLIYVGSDAEIYNGYLSCINLATCYLEMSDTQKAKDTMIFLESKLPQISEYLYHEIRASIHDTLANIALEEGHYAQADSYLKLSEDYYDSSSDMGILGGHYFIQLTRAKYWVAVENYDKALTLLLKMLSIDDVLYYGFEEDIYTLLKTIYYETGDYEKLHDVYEKLLTLNQEFEQTIQREYLEFSSYYKENNELKAYNATLSRRSSLAIFSTLLVSALLLVFFIFLRILAKRNVTDQLTGVYNRKQLNRLIKQYSRFGTPADFAVIMIDIDYFKKYNDTYGHPEGDKILKKVAKILLSCVRKKDILIRYGGEEFLLLANGVSDQVASSICERITKQINEAGLPHRASEISDHITLSIGLCHQSRANALNFESLVEEADECLYKSKKNGRNQFHVKSL